VKQHDHINNIFDSTKGMQKAEPSVFLFEQITAKIEMSKVGSPSYGSTLLKWGLAVFVSVVIGVNVISIFKFRTSGNEMSNVETTSSDSYLNNETVYNY